VQHRITSDHYRVAHDGLSQSYGVRLDNYRTVSYGIVHASYLWHFLRAALTDSYVRQCPRTHVAIRKSSYSIVCCRTGCHTSTRSRQLSLNGYRYLPMRYDSLELLLDSHRTVSYVIVDASCATRLQRKTSSTVVVTPAHGTCLIFECDCGSGTPARSICPTFDWSCGSNVTPAQHLSYIWIRLR
jgi:hypothetical protein